jgi:hypothetical protein
VPFGRRRLEDAEVVHRVPAGHQQRVELADAGGNRDHERQQADQRAGDLVEVAASAGGGPAW